MTNQALTIGRLVLALTAPALIARTYLLHALHIPDRPFDYMGGYASAVAVAIFATLIVVSVKKTWQLSTALVISGIFVAGHYGNFEHVRELDTALSFMLAHFLLDPEFVQGSALQITEPLLFAVLLLSPLAIFLMRGTFPLTVSRTTRMSLVTVCAALFALTLYNYNPTLRSWRLFDPAQENVMSAFKLLNAKLIAAEDLQTTSTELSWNKNLPPLNPDDQPNLTSLFNADLSGKPWVKVSSANPKPNIMLVMVESMSGAYLPHFASNWVDRDIQMPEFDKFAQDHATNYKNFLFNAKKTNRGEYALLCGDYDNLASQPVKMNVYIESADSKPCLPNILKDAGYRTVYLQSANLTFMNKDLFMPKAGFQDYLGFPYFQNPYQKNGWGVDDQTLFEHALNLVEELNSAGQPWFLAILNTGTHHPGLPPANWQETHTSQIQAAYAHADHTLTRFMNALQKNGTLDKSVVFVTGDEARASQGGSEPKRILNTHWGFLSVFGKDFKPATVTDTYAQIDYSVSVLDYLNLIDPSLNFYGRSLFRQYDQPRTLPVGVVTSNTVWLLRGNDNVTGCNINNFSCQSYSLQNKSFLFQGELSLRSNPKIEDDQALLRHFLARNEKQTPTFALDQTVDLAPLRDVHISERTGDQKIVYRRLGPIPAGYVMHVQIALQVKSGEIRVAPYHSIKRLKETEIKEPLQMPAKIAKAGDRIIVDFTSTDEKAVEEYAINVIAKSLTKTSVVAIEKAQVKIKNSQVIAASGILTKKYFVQSATN